MKALFNQHAVSRRSFIKRMLGGSAALMLAALIAITGPLSASAGASAGPEKLVTSAALNLRSQPSLSSSVILVIPMGAQVGYQETEQNGFTKVSYAGSIGWAKSEYLSQPSGSGTGDMPAYRGQVTTNAAVNQRSGAGTNYSVIQVLPAGATVELYDAYENYFWLVSYNGEYGWVHQNFLELGLNEVGGDDMPAYTGMGKTTATVNLRGGPGTSYAVLTVVPAGSSIELFAGPAGSWGLVRYNNQIGYIHSDYIASV